MSVFVGLLALIRPDIGAKYWVTFKKSWGCIAKRVRLQKCETNFKEDIKNTLLARFIIRRPKLVKPLTVLIEVMAILIVAVTIWSIAEVAKGGLSLWIFGTCNVSRPSACVIGQSEVCGIDQEAPSGAVGHVSRWFSDWGAVITGIPDRIRRWDARHYFPQNATFWSYEEGRPYALDIFDSGCPACLASFRNKQRSGFFDRHNATHIPYVIVNPVTGEDTFPNSRLVSSYITALRLQHGAIAADDNPVPLDWRIIERMFTEHNEAGVNYQAFIKSIEADEAKTLLESWLFDFGVHPDDIQHIRTLAMSDTVADRLLTYRHIVEDRINANVIPTTIFGGRRHAGIYE
ncbi:hypothetical protein FWC63_02095 [Candidatus Saccharibacteria bacterium]|nr:hypothetical protein [Candidatus Saccharibacteria bacterium]